MIISNNQAIADILKAIDEGRIQLPDFQRGWVWEDQRIRADDFDTYFAERQQALLRLIAEATGKAVSGREDRQEELSLFDRTEMETTED